MTNPAASNAINPFEPPRAELDDVPANAGEAGAWNDGNVLVTSIDATLPDRCLKCNAPAEGYRLKRQLYWHNPALYVLIISPLIYAVVALIVRKKAKVMVGLCPEHRARRRNDIIIAWVAGLGSIVGLPLLAAYTQQPAIALVGLVGFLGAMFFVVYRVNLLRPKSIDKSHAFLEGASPEFLHSLPRFRR